MFQKTTLAIFIWKGNLDIQRLYNLSVFIRFVFIFHYLFFIVT